MPLCLWVSEALGGEQLAHSAHRVNQDSVWGGMLYFSDKAEGTGIQGMQRSDGVQEPWVTLTAESLWVLPGQLPFQRPVGEGKVHRLKPLSRQARLSAGQQPLLSALGRWHGGGGGRNFPLTAVTLHSQAGGPRHSALLTSHPQGRHQPCCCQFLCILGPWCGHLMGPLPAMPF